MRKGCIRRACSIVAQIVERTTSSGARSRPCWPAANAFRVLVERHQRAVHAVIYRLVHNVADAEDLSQQAFLSAYDALGSFDRERRFSSWLYRIAINLAKDHLRSKKRSEVSLDEAPATSEPMFIAPTDSPHQSVEARDRRRSLERALMTLSFDDREILVLKDVEELTFEEIREILRRPITALKIRAVRARKRLRLALERLASKEAT
jgi:RNA polymerase sigma-70 factor, ECF subfamily